MPLTQKQSRDELTQNFLTVFNRSHPINATVLISFLEHHELGGFVKKGELPKLITKNYKNRDERHIICLSIDTNLSNDFIRQLIQYLRSATSPIHLYWTWELPENNSYIAFRVKLKRIDKTIRCHTEILNSPGSYFILPPISKMIYQLIVHLPEYEIISDVRERNDVALMSDNAYWTALSLFLKLTQDEDKNYINKLNTWEKTNQSIVAKVGQHLESRMLSTVSCFHPPLFYAEHTLIILKMDVFEKIVKEKLKFIPSLITDIQLLRALRTITVCYLLYNNPYSSSSQITFIYGLNALTAMIMQKTSAGLTQIVLINLFKSFLNGCSLALNLYLTMPGTDIDREIISPRYIFTWMSGMINITLIQLITLVALLFVFALMQLTKFLFHLNISSKNQAGFHSITLIGMSLFNPTIEKYIFKFTQWKLPQTAEETILNSAKFECQEPCEFKINTPLYKRIWQQLFSDKQVINIVGETRSQTLKCEIKITPNAKSNSSGYLLECQSRLFPWYPRSVNETAALAKLPLTSMHSTNQSLLLEVTRL